MASKEADSIYKLIVEEEGHIYVCGDVTMAEHVYLTIRYDFGLSCTYMYICIFFRLLPYFFVVLCFVVPMNCFFLFALHLFYCIIYNQFYRKQFCTKQFSPCKTHNGCVFGVCANGGWNRYSNLFDKCFMHSYDVQKRNRNHYFICMIRYFNGFFIVLFSHIAFIRILC